MPDIDLDPGDYRERKPTGWRWRLPWSHDDDTKLPMVMFFVMVGWLVFFFVGRDQMTSGTMFGVAALGGAIAGGMLILWLRD